MIVDFHTHVFSPDLARDRDRYLASDPTFRELYESPKATLATGADLLSSMEDAGIDVSVALGFAWSDPATVGLHNDYLLHTARNSSRIVAFPNLPLTADDATIAAEARRCIAVGARGFGELRPDNLGFDLAGPRGDHLAALAAELDAVLLFHVSEPVGHPYPGKQGLALNTFAAFVTAHPEVKVVGAHWGGGLPFYAAMPEVWRGFTNLHVDTAASSLLYDETVYRRSVELTGAATILFGSDFPLLSQARSRRRIEEAGLDTADREAILGGNAAALLGLG